MSGGRYPNYPAKHNIIRCCPHLEFDREDILLLWGWQWGGIVKFPSYPKWFSLSQPNTIGITLEWSCLLKYYITRL